MNEKDRLDFGKMGGLLPAIVQDAASGEVLMLAFMDPQAWDLTLKTKEAHYYSRTRCFSKWSRWAGLRAIRVTVPAFTAAGKGRAGRWRGP